MSHVRNGQKQQLKPSDDAYRSLQKNYNSLLQDHARALIAVDQLRVAKYLAGPRGQQEKVRFN